MLSKPISILLVDDKPENLISLQAMLETENRHFITAFSGNEALKKVLNNNIGLIMLDVQMPEMDGFEVARILQSNPKTKDIAIIFVTAISKDENFLLKGLNEGAVDYLYKPLDVRITQAKVKVFEELYHQRQELKNSYKEIERVNKQLDQFVYIVSHDLKAPLRGISSLASWIEEDVKDLGKPEVLENLDLMKNRVARLQNMITGMLEYSRSRRRTGNKENTDVEELLNSTIDLLSPPENIKIIIQKGLPIIYCEKLKFQQVFQNLISNAIKYNNKEEGKIEINCIETEREYKFFVKDNGPGIAPEHYERIFGIFQTINPKDEVESTGVGLAIVKTIVEDQGGKIWVESELGKGSTFIFEWMK